MGEVAQEEMELENVESANHKVDNGDFHSDDIEKENLIELDKAEGFEEKCLKTT